MAVKATLALLQARDSRFGDRRLKHLQARTDLERAKAELELTRLKVEAAKKAMEGDGGAIVIGIEALLEAPWAPSEVKEALRKALESGRLRTVERWRLGLDSDNDSTA